MKVTIYTDGACSGNPGIGGYGTILVFEDSKGNLHEKELSEGYLQTTNNQMELMAVISGLEALKTSCDVTIYSDSKYVVDAINNKWLENWVKKNWKTADKKPVKNIELWQKYIEVSQKHSIEFIWVKGHAGHAYNERCDNLAVSACKKENLKPHLL
ncbi:MAG: ribonuclease HI [bacterium]|nr:ribonuclease HI [bacterium]